MDTDHVLLTSAAMKSLAERIQLRLTEMGDRRFEVVDLEEETFANGEVITQIDPSTRLTQAVLLMDMHPNPNTCLWRQAFAVDALQSSGVDHIYIVNPYFPYGRQDKRTSKKDKKGKQGQPLSAAVTARLLKTFHPVLRRFICLDPHVPQLAGFYDPIGFDALIGAEVHAEHFRRVYQGNFDQVMVVAPDAGGFNRAKEFANLIDPRVILASIYKTRPATNVSEVTGYAGDKDDIKGRDVLIYDDMIDTGGSAIKAAHYLLELGARKVFIVATHGIFSPAMEGKGEDKRLVTAEERFKKSGVSVVVTETIPRDAAYIAANQEWLTYRPIDELLAKAIHEATTTRGRV